MNVERAVRIAIATYAAQELGKCRWHEYGKCVDTEEKRMQWFRCGYLISAKDRDRIRKLYLR